MSRSQVHEKYLKIENEKITETEINSVAFEISGKGNVMIANKNEGWTYVNDTWHLAE